MRTLASLRRYLLDHMVSLRHPDILEALIAWCLTSVVNLKVSHPHCVVKIQVREENPILYSHKTQLNVKLSLLLYYNITETCFDLNYRPSSGCI